MKTTNMTKASISAFAFIAFIFAGIASAGNMQQNVGFTDLKKTCSDPASMQNQIAPTNIQITCKDVITKWLPVGDGAFSMGTSRYVTTSVQSDKYTVAAEDAFVPIANQVATCPRFKQVVETLTVAKATTCAELTSYNGSSTDFCAATLNSMRASNLEAANLTETGAVLDLCISGNAQNNNQQKNGQQR